MEQFRPLQKNETMDIIELMYRCCQPEVFTVDNVIGINLLQLEELETTVENSFDNADFFRAYNQLTGIKKRIEKQEQYPAVKIMLERIDDIIRTGANRICDVCGGSGPINASCNNPNAEDCRFCDGGLL